VYLVGFIIRIHHDARSAEREILGKKIKRISLAKNKEKFKNYTTFFLGHLDFEQHVTVK